jgi:hypothetical protein
MPRHRSPEPISPAPPPALAWAAQEQLARAASLARTDETMAVEERSVWRPDSLILQNCWETLADAGSGPEALSVAMLASERQPASLQEALYSLARQAQGKPDLLRVVEQTLAEQRGLLQGASLTPAPSFPQQLLLCAATAAHLNDAGTALTYLEKLDQTDRAWERIVASPEQRMILAETIVRAGPHPLVLMLLDGAIRRFGDAGAELLLRVSEQIDPAITPDNVENKQARLLRHCVDGFRYGVLTTLQSHRMAAAVYARAGRFDETLKEVETIANIQDGHRIGNFGARSDQNLLRQVKRPQSDADIDFQVYTLREAIRAVPLRYIPRETRVELAAQLAQLGMKSDGWTAAGAASTLSELGALKFAADVVASIKPTDATRSEGVIALVRGLVAVGDMAVADEQVRKGLEWARASTGRNPERALIWGLAEAYLEFDYPQQTLALLDEWRSDSGFMARMRGRFNPTLSDDELRLKRLRLQALLRLDNGGPELSADERALFDELQRWAPQLLEGEALIDFYADGLLRPLLTAGRTRAAWALLPHIQVALASSTGEKHATRVRQVASLLARQVRLAAVDAPFMQEQPETLQEDTLTVFGHFLNELWTADANRGLWQVVYGINGSLPLVHALEGPATIVAIANAAYTQGGEWA